MPRGKPTPRPRAQRPPNLHCQRTPVDDDDSSAVDATVEEFMQEEEKTKAGFCHDLLEEMDRDDFGDWT